MSNEVRNIKTNTILVTSAYCHTPDEDIFTHNQALHIISWVMFEEDTILFRSCKVVTLSLQTYCDGLLPVQPNPRYNCAVATQRRSDIRGNG
jgi:hypothetical protein